MTLSKGQQYLGWGILVACLASIPVGLTCKPPADEKPAKSGFSGFMANKDRILVVKLTGMIYDDEGEESLIPQLDSPMSVRKRIRKAAKDNHVKAILLRINSPGGTVATSQEITDAVKAFRDAGKPVYVSMGDVAASGGYYVASAADKIFAQPGTLTGSIGVIMHLLNISELEKKVGAQAVVVKSGAFKDIGSMDRAMTPDEQKLLQSIIMDSYDQFVTAISIGRKMDKEAVKKLADGRIYSGRQAKDVHLVDELGGYEEALADLQKLAKDKYHLSKDLDVDEGRSLSVLASLLQSAVKTPPPEASLAKLLPTGLNHKFCNQPLWLKE